MIMSCLNDISVDINVDSPVHGKECLSVFLQAPYINKRISTEIE